MDVPSVRGILDERVGTRESSRSIESSGPLGSDSCHVKQPRERRNAADAAVLSLIAGS